jgi:hypothetical protein
MRPYPIATYFNSYYWQMRLLALIFFLPMSAVKAQDTIHFGHHIWKVRNSPNEIHGPGNNYWSSDKRKNVWVDKKGYLHLRLTKDPSNQTKWYCAQVESVDAMGYGTYQFEIVGAIDKLNENVIFGMFSYPDNSDKPLDGFDEIDIEYSRWGKKNSPTNFDYNAYGDDHSPAFLDTRNYHISLGSNTYTTQRYLRHPKKMVFESMSGFHDNDADPYQYDFIPASIKFKPAERKMPVIVNLWLYKPHGSASKPIPPSDGKEVEIVIRSFKFLQE